LDQPAAQNGYFLSGGVDNGRHRSQPVFSDEDPMALNTKPGRL
jgi:hypothetical protein